jgi:Tfp pilus assembly protein PilF
VIRSRGIARAAALMMARSVSMQKKHDKVLNEFQKAHELDPDDANMVTEYSWGLTWAGRAQKGIPLMLDVMRLNPVIQAGI